MGEVAARAAQQTMRLLSETRVHVDIRAGLGSIKLSGISHRCMPPDDATDRCCALFTGCVCCDLYFVFCRMASKASALTKRSVPSPFVYVELADFLPRWASSKKGDNDDGEMDPSAKVVFI